MKLKHGTSPIGIKPEILLAIAVANDIYKEKGFDLVLTSINDSTHADTSRHYQGMAVDLRTRDFNGGVARQIAEELRNALGRHYLVINESNHIHVSYKPRKP